MRENKKMWINMGEQENLERLEHVKTIGRPKHKLTKEDGSPNIAFDGTRGIYAKKLGAALAM